jgi:hypothetical protein
MNKKIKLASDITIEKYEIMEEEENKGEIANFVFTRLSERYLDPLENSTKKNGFSLMANSCLLIETYESFREGWDYTEVANWKTFKSFFYREIGFKDFKHVAYDFYSCVRCGILHQGETKGGWKIKRNEYSPLFNRDEKILNAQKFFNELRISLESYRELLISSDWDDEVWVNCRKKISYIIQNCE